MELAEETFFTSLRKYTHTKNRQIASATLSKGVIMKNYIEISFIFLQSLLWITLLLSPSWAGAHANGNEYIDLGRFSKESINEMLNKASQMETDSKKIEYISEKFLGIPYKSSTLIGDSEHSEKLTINLAGVDCFTLLDYVEAMRLSGNYDQFRQNLVKTRYKGSDIEYRKRNHFFTDWSVYNDLVIDVTGKIGEGKTSSELKQLNRINRDKRYLPDIPVVSRNVYFITSGDISKDIATRIRTGDYIGIYSKMPGLDVSHTGIAIRRSGKLYFRNASSMSINEKVVDEPLLEYIKNKPGIVILRPLPPGNVKK